MTASPQFRRPEKPAKSTDPRYITLYLGSATKDALKAVDAFPGTGNGEMTRAARINAICGRYAIFLTQFTPTLSEAEWCGLMSIFEGGITDELVRELWGDDHGLAEHVRKAHEAGLAQGWQYDRRDLEKSLGECSEEVLFGVAEVVDRFWASDLNDGRPPRQRLEDCGANISRQTPPRGHGAP